MINVCRYWVLVHLVTILKKECDHTSQHSSMFYLDVFMRFKIDISCSGFVLL